MNKNIILLIGCILMLGATGCEKFLEKKYNSRLLVPTSIEDLQALLDNVNVMNNTAPDLLEMVTDDIYITDETLEEYASYIPIYAWDYFTVGHPNSWSQSYSAIYISNLCLERLAEVNRNNENEANWDKVKGASLFFRGENYLNLLWVFAKAYDENTADIDHGIVIRSGSDYNVPSVRSTVRESYSQVLADIHSSIPLLPLKDIVPTRPSKLAAYGLLSRAFLSMRMYDSAFHYANLVLEVKDELIDYNGQEILKTFPFNEEVVYYASARITSLADNRYCFVDSTLYAQYDDMDLRKSVFFFADQGYHRFRGSYSGNPYELFSGVATDELWLTKAECLARKGLVTDAMETLNTLLVNRYQSGSFQPYTAINQEHAIQQILSERRKELLFRYLRWMDLKRLNKEGAGIHLKRIINGQEYNLPPNDPRYALPLPKDIVELTGIPQN